MYTVDAEYYSKSLVISSSTVCTGGQQWSEFGRDQSLKGYRRNISEQIPTDRHTHMYQVIQNS